MIKLIYIASFSRSGSTLLDIILGNHPDICGAGELSRLMTSGWRDNQPCGCGANVHDCVFWSSVMNLWGEDPETYIALQNKFERLRQIPVLLCRDIGADFDSYARQTLALLRAIQDESGRPVIVDSSKNPARALALSKIKGIDMRLIHLVRDRGAVARSLAQPYKKDPAGGIEADMPGVARWRTALEWRFLNGLIRWLRPEHYSVLRYEEMISDPVRTMEAIARFVDCNPDPLKEAVQKNQFVSGHKVAGNRLRMQKKISIRT